MIITRSTEPSKKGELMRKKLSILAFALISVFVLAACSSSEDQTYGGYTAETIEATLQNTALSLEAMTADEAQQYADYYESMAEDDEEYAIYAEMFSNWAEFRSEAGDYIGFGDFDIEKTGKTVTATQIIDYSDRDMKLIYVMTARNGEITSINAELVYTLGETMQKAALNTVMGLLTVFVMLILIAFIISLFKYIPMIQEKFSGKGKEEEKKTAAAPAATAVSAAPAAATDDTELVAVIAAAIAASTGTSTDDFVVRSIKRRY